MPESIYNVQWGIAMPVTVRYRTTDENPGDKAGRGDSRRIKSLKRKQENVFIIFIKNQSSFRQ